MDWPGLKRQTGHADQYRTGGLTPYRGVRQTGCQTQTAHSLGSRYKHQYNRRMTNSANKTAKAETQPEAATPEASTEEVKLTYLEEFHAINGRRGYEFLDDLELTGDRAEDKALVVAALEAAARAGVVAVAAVDEASSSED